MTKQKYRIQYELSNGKLCIDKAIFAEDENDATKIALVTLTNLMSHKLCSDIYRLLLERANLIINKEL